MKIYISTAKYIKLAIVSYKPFLAKIAEKNKENKEELEEINDLIEMYEDICKKLNKYQNPFSKINQNKGDFEEIEIDITEDTMEYLTRLVLRMLKNREYMKNKIEQKKYISDENKKILEDLNEKIRILKSNFDNPTTVFGKSKDLWPIEFPWENSQNIIVKKPEKTESSIFFPTTLIKRLPKDLNILCQEFNFNYQNKIPNACILLLRRIIPLSIVRFFQKIGEEWEIKYDWEFLDTKDLMWKIENRLTEKKRHKEIINIKPLIDSSQHSYTLSVSLTDVEWAGIKVRLFLDDLFSDKTI